MKLAALVLFCIGLDSCNGPEQFQKYSYYVFAAKENADGVSLKHAACFFYKKSGQLFLVTNWHVISDVDPLSGKPDAIPVHDTLYIRVKSKATGEWIPCRIDIREIQRNFHWRRADVVPDVFACKIKLPDDAEVNSIEEFVDKPSTQMENDREIYVFGYPDGMQFKSPISYYNSYNLIKSYRAIVKYTDSEIQWGPGAKDSMDFEVITPDDFIGSGYSGSPTFCKVNGHFQFAGVYFAFDNGGLAMAYVVRPQIFQKVIDTTKLGVTAVREDHLPLLEEY